MAFHCQARKGSFIFNLPNCFRKETGYRENLPGMLFVSLGVSILSYDKGSSRFSFFSSDPKKDLWSKHKLKSKTEKIEIKAASPERALCK